MCIRDRTQQRPDTVGNLKKDKLFPCQCVTSDQYICGEPERLYNSRCHTLHQDKYIGGTIFCDVSSRFISIHHQVSLAASDTIQAKISFENSASNNGVKIAKYHTDNGIFKSNAFLEELANHKQLINFSGVGAPHQNAIAERSICIITFMVRTMMAHVAMHQPKGVITVNLWPMVMDYAFWLFNHIPHMCTGFTPM